MASTKTIGRIFDLTIDCRNVRAKAKLCLQRHFQLLFKLFSSHFPPRLKTILGVSEKLECLRLSTWTILIRVLFSCICIFIFIRRRHDKSSATLVFVRNAKWRPKNPVKNNFSSLLLLRPRIVKISVVDGLLGCS